MIINVKVHTNSKQNKVKQNDSSNFDVYTTTIPENGKANKSVIELLAEFFRVGKTKIKILQGETSKIKKIQIDD